MHGGLRRIGLVIALCVGFPNFCVGMDICMVLQGDRHPQSATDRSWRGDRDAGESVAVWMSLCWLPAVGRHATEVPVLTNVT